MCRTHRLGVILHGIGDGNIWGPDPLWATMFRSVGGVSHSREHTKARERRMLMIRNTVIITVQQKKRPQVLVRLPLVHRFSWPSAFQLLRLFRLYNASIRGRYEMRTEGYSHSWSGLDPLVIMVICRCAGHILLGWWDRWDTLWARGASICNILILSGSGVVIVSPLLIGLVRLSAVAAI